MVDPCGCGGWQGSAPIEGGIKDNHFILRASGLALLPFPTVPWPEGGCLVWWKEHSSDPDSTVDSP